MKFLFLLTFVALITVSWTHPVIRAEFEPYITYIERVAQTQSLSLDTPRMTETSATSTAPDEEIEKTEKTAEKKTEAPAPVKKTSPPPQPKKEPEPVKTASAPAPVQGDFQTQLELAVHARINTVRQEFGLSTLAWNDALTSVARGHSADMLTRDYFSHEDPSGCDMVCRADAAGVTWQAIGENIYMTDGYELDVDEMAAMIVSGWMNSEGHRANILRASFTTQGIGVAYRGESVYTTELLTKPRQ